MIFGGSFFKGSHNAVCGKGTGTLQRTPGAVLKEFSKKVLLGDSPLPSRM